MNNQNHALDLLEESFPGLKINILRCESNGFSWTSKPICKEKNGKIISHVGLLEYPMVVEGQEYQVCALHAICTTPLYRKQGLATELIHEILKKLQTTYEFFILFTEIPLFYEKLSFRYEQEYRFHLHCHSKESQTLVPVVSPKDNPLFLRLFQERERLSNTVWVKDYGTIAPFNTLFATYPTHWSLSYSSSLDAILSFQLEGNTVHLFDVITQKIPPLDMIVDHFPKEIEQIYFYFCPDRLTSKASLEPYLFDKSHLMVYGDWPTDKPFMLSPISRC